MLWDIDSQDGRLPDPQAVVDLVMDHVFAGARVLMHDSPESQQTTAEALDLLLEALAEAGFRFAPLCR